MMNLLQIAFFSAFVSCGLAVLRNTKFSLLPYVYICAFITAFVFNGLNGVTDTFFAGMAAGLVAAVMVGVFHRSGKHSYLFIVVPVIYCIGPGGAMCKTFQAIFTGRVSGAIPQLIFIFKDAFGIWLGIVLGTALMNKISAKQAELV